MFRLFFIPILLICYSLFADSDWLDLEEERVDTAAVEWALEQKVPTKEEFADMLSTGCTSCPKVNVSTTDDPQFLVFASFSMPLCVWKELSKSLEEVGGTFVIRGLPGNSFSLLAKRVMSLRKEGVNAQIQIDPKLFRTHEVNVVPTFVLRQGETYNKISGNVSVGFALEKIAIEDSRPNT